MHKIGKLKEDGLKFVNGVLKKEKKKRRRQQLL
jgi:transcription termination factor NusB